MIDNIGLYTQSPGTAAVKSAHRVILRVMPSGPRRAKPGDTVTFELSGRAHLLIMNEGYLVVSIRIKDNTANMFQQNDHPLRRILSSIDLVSRVRWLAGSDRQIESISYYSQVTRSLYDLLKGPNTMEEYTLDGVSDWDFLYMHRLHREDANEPGWSKVLKVKIPIVTCLTNGRVTIPTMLMKERLALEVTFSSANAAFTPYLPGDAGTIALSGGRYVVEGFPYDSRINTYNNATFDYKIDDMYYEMCAINLELGAQVSATPWTHFTNETTVERHETNGTTEESVTLNTRKTSVQSVRSFFFDSRALTSQRFDVLPVDLYPQCAFTGVVDTGRVTWWSYEHGSNMYPYVNGTGDKGAPSGDPLQNWMDMMRAVDTYRQSVTSSMYIPPQGVMGSVTTNYPGARDLNKIRNTTPGGSAMDLQRSDLFSGTPAWYFFARSFLDSMTNHFEWDHPNQPGGARGELIRGQRGGGKFMMVCNIGPFPEDPMLIQGANTYRTPLLLRWTREAQLVSGTRSNEYGPVGERVQIEQVPPSLLVIVTSSLALSISPGDGILVASD